MDYIIILIGLFWICFSKQLPDFAAKYNERLKMNLMSAFEWRMIIIFMGCGACLFGILVVTGIVRHKH